MKNKLGPVLVIFLVLVLATSCSKLGSKDSTKTPTAVNYRQGIGGLVIESLEGLPPKEIYEGGNFKIALKLKNSGAYDIKLGDIEIAGFDERYVILSEKKKELTPLLGKSATNTEGDFYIEEFNGQTLKSVSPAKEYPAVYYVVANYDYRTEAQVDVCINTNLYADLKLTPESCKPVQSTTLTGQGAPVAISKIEQIIIPEESRTKIVFKIFVENKGQGTLKTPVYLDEVRLSNRMLSCEPSQRFLDLQQKGEKVFVCSTYEDQPAAYQAPLYAALYYTYQIKENKEFKIKSIQV